MAKKALPDPLRRRHLIEQEMNASQSLALAEAYLEEGRAIEAVVFLAKAEASDRIATLIEQASADGDTFLVKQIADATGQDPGRVRWLATAEAAEAAGKHRYAEMARRHARSSED